MCTALAVAGKGMDYGTSDFKEFLCLFVFVSALHLASKLKGFFMCSLMQRKRKAPV